MRKYISIFMLLISLAGYAQRTLPAIKVEDEINIVGDAPKLKFNGVTQVFGGGGTGTGTSTYTGTNGNISLGGYVAGTPITDSSFTYIIKTLLVQYQLPAFSSFSISGQSTTVEVGTTISGTKSFTWAFTNSGNVAANTLDIEDASASTYLATNRSNTSPGSYAVNVQKTTATSNTWRVYATNTNAGNFSRDFTVNWNWKRYWGFNNDNTSSNAEILALSGNELSTSRAKTFSTGAPVGDQFFWYAYPASFGDASSITVNGFPASSAFTKTVLSFTNALGAIVNYNLYISNTAYSSSASIVFN